jgi:hypothetical protein
VPEDDEQLDEDLKSKIEIAENRDFGKKDEESC